LALTAGPGLAKKKRPACGSQRDGTLRNSPQAGLYGVPMGK